MLAVRCALAFLCAIVALEVVAGQGGDDDPYKVLGVSRRASIKEIKRAYKSMARQWHPDKNSDSRAHEKFMAAARAYQVLSDPLKRERYDKFGTFDEPAAAHSYASHSFDQFFNFGFGGFDNGNSYFQKHRISLRMFSHTILERSYTQPYIVFAYSGYCQLCFRIEPIWQSIVEDLEPLGYGIATVNAMTDGNLLEKLRISRLPSIVVVVEGRVMHFRGTMQPLSAKAVRLFARDVIPNTFLITITNHDGLRRFVDQWLYFNKISVLILSSKEVPRMRYMLTAMKYATFARFAYVYLSDGSAEVTKMQQALDIKCFNCENILIFNDYPQNGPKARLFVDNGQQFTMDVLGTLIERNKHLILPRLSSQAYFDDVCPFSSRTHRTYCVLSTFTSSSNHEKHVQALRQFVQLHSSMLKSKRIAISYVFTDVQKDFIEPFLSALNDQHESTAQANNLLVLWRFDQQQVRFAWLQTQLHTKFLDDFESKLEVYVTDPSKLVNVATLKPLIDEYSPSWFTRLSRTLVRMVETVWFHLTKEEALPLLSAIGTFLFILFVGYGLSYVNTSGDRRSNTRKESRSAGSREQQWHPEDPRTAPEINNNNRARLLTRQQRIMREMEPMMHELRAETYFGMIRLLKPGCRSIVILVDEESKDMLLPQFAKHVWPFRNNKTFSFGYLMVEKNLPWFRKLLEHTLPAESGEVCEGETKTLYGRLKFINPRKTLGTVLVLCGWKLYFNMYHPMHTAPGKTHFLGFDEDGGSLSSSNSDVDEALREEVQALRKRRNLKLEDVLNGFPNWLDRLVEGSIRRYYIPEWPDNLR